MSSLKVLLSAYSCRPGKGSEPGVGWHVVREVAKYHQVWLLTRANNVEAITNACSANPIPNLQVIACSLPAWLEKLNHQQRAVQLHYYLWQIAAYQQAKPLHREIGFDLIHHVTYVKYWSPSFLSLLPVPFLWGPVGGGESTPQSFHSSFSWRGRTYEFARNVARMLAAADPFVRITARRSVLARATTEETAQKLRQLGAKRVEVQSQLGISTAEIAQLGELTGNLSPNVRFVSAGRLLHWKGFHLGLQAFAEADLPADAEYWIVGDGPQRQALQNLAQSLGIARQVKFLGALSREDTWQHVAGSWALVHPSLHESGGLVCLEAMAVACPVICLDWGGPAILVSRGAGFKVVVEHPYQVVTDLAHAMTHLATHPEQVTLMGRLGRNHVQTAFAWEIKGGAIASLYQTLATNHQKFDLLSMPGGVRD
ncbi:glycosyltransferase family 4 protein [Geitlerinema sp. PCC 9228]|uniref:glycosyltransferase family 4 protein n=1 Tax=Geitlerinema sp. PCC 9228 TaxID=111611 RepID=UPI0008F9A3A2|nr:glycosyltransferase family 4 protein [Geitlerinema sp. PCC 9228]